MLEDSQRISVFGLGYVGLCTAVLFAQKGFDVIGVDIDEGKVEMIRRGEPPIHEPGLEEALNEPRTKNRLKVTINHREAIWKSDISLITVGTPSQPDGRIELSYIKSVSRDIGDALGDKSGYHIVAVKSTVVPGTSDSVVKPILEENAGKVCGADFGLCSNPEFLREGKALEDTINPDRIVIGEYDERSGDALEAMYRAFHQEDLPPILRTNLPTAEVIKYASNAFLAAKVSFINTIANACEKIPSVDVTEVAEAVGLDHRISPRFLRAGLGYGGSCFPKDLKAFIARCNEIGYKPELLEAVEKVNALQPLKVIEKAEELIGDLRSQKIALLGLAFKPDTDDMRGAVSIKIVGELLVKGAVIHAYDPAALGNAKRIFGDRIKYCETVEDCLKGADCSIIITEWDEFRTLEPEDFKNNMRMPVLIDGRRVTNAEKFRDNVKYAAIGLGH
jgi:UDPglucose 6-dehydrogenase